MTSSVGAGLEVTSHCLRTDAQTWSHKSQQVSEIAARVHDLHLSHLEAGIFQVIVSTYNALVNQVAVRSSEGQQVFSEISEVLLKTVDNYERQESETENVFRNIYESR